MQTLYLNKKEREHFEELRFQFATAAREVGFHVTAFSLSALDSKQAIVCVDRMTSVGLMMLLSRVRKEHDKAC